MYPLIKSSIKFKHIFSKSCVNSVGEHSCLAALMTSEQTTCEKSLSLHYHTSLVLQLSYNYL
jgi:hypothetical protein